MIDMSKNLKLDEILEIVEVGDQDTFDLSVSDTHCYFANGILVHNSADIEADADAVIILDRKEKKIGLTRETIEGVFDPETKVRVSRIRYQSGGSTTLNCIDAEARFESI